MVKIYGEVAEADGEQAWSEVSNLSIALSPAAMEKFAKFVAHAASEMKRLGSAYDHVHFMDFCADWDETWPDIQLTKIYGNDTPSGSL